jgi:hypothetical protein
MARISAYPKHIPVQPEDCWIGTKASNLITRNFTAKAVGEYINVSGSISMATCMLFKFKVTNAGPGDVTGVPNETLFSNITSLQINTLDVSNQDTVGFLEYIVGTEIIISEQNKISTFGHYTINSYTQIEDTAFYTMNLTYIGGNGFIEHDMQYNICSFVLASEDTNTTYTLDSVQNGSNSDIRLIGSDSTENIVKLEAGSNVTLTDTGSNILIDVTGGLVYQGGYNAATNIPDLTTSPNNIKKGWTYTVTSDGTFFGEQLRSGDVLIAEIDSPLALVDWTTVQNNIDLASLTQIGIGNVNEAGAGNKNGLSVSYASGTATVGLDITGLPNLSVTIADADLDSLEIPIYNGDTSEANEKIEVSALLSAASRKISYATTITDTATISHFLASSDVMVQLYDITTGETVYADVDRISTTQVTITFASTPTNSVRVLVQKIG